MTDAAGSVKGELKKSLLLLTLSAITQAIAYVCFYPIFESLATKESDKMWLWIGISILFVIISALCRWIGQNYDYSGHSAYAQYELRSRQGDKLREFPLELLSKRRAGQWSAIISGNVDEVISYSMTVASVLIYALVIPITVGVLTFLFDWKIAIVILLIFPIIIPLYRWRKPKFDRGMKYLNTVHSELTAESVEYVQGLPILKLFNSAGSRSNKLNESIEKVKEVQIIGHNKGTKANLIITSAIEIGLLISIALTMLFVLNASSSVMVMAALMVIIIRFAEPVSNFVAMTLFFSLFEAGYEQIQKMMTIKPLKYPEKTKKPQGTDIQFENVSFKYEGNESWTLKNINFKIEKRAIIALVGASGSGKTTLTKLIMRYADPQEGAIKIGGIDIREISQKDLMSHITAVFQDVYLFDDSIINNIRMAKGSATDEEVIAVAKAAQCHDFISKLPNGYNTRVGDIGGSLSGGERQRISIARALLKDTPIVILDEPTSSLDAYSELAVQKAIDTLVKDKIVIVIAHRLSTIVGANQIFVLDHGNIVEQGTHEGLIQQKGNYYKLWINQRGVDSQIA